MSVKTWLKRKGTLRTIKTVITHPPEQELGVFQTERGFFTVVKVTEDKVHIILHAADASPEKLRIINLTPYAVVKLNNDLRRNSFLVEFRLVFGTMWCQYDEMMFGRILDFVSDEKQTSFTDLTSGIVHLRKRDNKWIDVGYFDTPPECCDDNPPFVITRTFPIGEDIREATEFIVNYSTYRG